MSGPGGRFLNPFKRRGEPPFALWQEIVPVDAKGTEVRFTVPQYASGKIRIMAVGSAAPKQGLALAGRTEASMEVRGTLILKPLLPLAAAPGDEFDGALVVANTVEGSGPRRAGTREDGKRLRRSGLYSGTRPPDCDRGRKRRGNHQLPHAGAGYPWRSRRALYRKP